MERRLAAILAADVVGYSRLIREDEAGTLVALKAHRKEIVEPKTAEDRSRRADGRPLRQEGGPGMVGRGGIMVALAAAGWMAFAGIAGAQTPDPRATTHIIDFPHCCPRPGWWDEVEIETRIDSMETFLAVWQNQALTDEQKAKALFRAIEDFVRRDDDITAAAVNYYYWVDRDYDHIRRLYEFGVGRYLDYDRPLENYSGKAGDMSAGMVNNLAKLYLREGKPERAVPWLRYILDVREAEVNDHLLETAAAHLGDALNRLGRRPEAIKVLLAARRDYDGDWEKRLDDQLANLRDEMGRSYYLHDTRLGVRVLGLAMIVVLGGMMLWRMRRGRG